MMKYTRHEGHFKTSDGYTLYFEYTTPQVRTVLILLHGLGGDLSAWNDEWQSLEKKYSLVALDLRGHGLSDRPRNESAYKLSRLAKDVIELIQYLKLNQIVLVGHCYGGAVALQTTVQYSKHISKLILVEASYKPPTFSRYLPSDSFTYAALKRLVPYLPLSHLSGHRDFHEFQGTQDWNWERLLSDIAYTSIRSYLFTADQFHRLDMRHVVPTIVQPTLIVEGEKDTIIPIHAAVQMHHLIPHSSLRILRNANHISVINNPIEIAKKIIEFVK